MPEQSSQKIQPWKALSSSALAEDDFSKRNFRANERTCSMGASVSKPMDRKTKNSVVGDEFGASNAASTDKASQKVTTKEDYDDV